MLQIVMCVMDDYLSQLPTSFEALSPKDIYTRLTSGALTSSSCPRPLLLFTVLVLACLRMGRTLGSGSSILSYLVEGTPALRRLCRVPPTSIPDAAQSSSKSELLLSPMWPYFELLPLKVMQFSHTCLISCIRQWEWLLWKQHMLH